MSTLSRPDTATHQYVSRIPKDIRAKATGRKLHVPVGSEVSVVAITAATQSVRVSLKTKDPSVARIRHAQVDSYVRGVWHALRNDEEVSLTHRQAVALAGELYASWQKRWVAWPEAADINTDTKEVKIVAGYDKDHDGAGEPWWDRIEDSIATHEDDPLPATRPLFTKMLLAKGIGKLDEGSLAFVASAFINAMRDAASDRMRKAKGDYSPSPAATRFPEWQDTKGLPLKSLVEGWWAEAKATGRSTATYDAYLGAITQLIAFLGHDDALRVTTDDIVRFKDNALALGRSAKTIGDGYLAAFRSVFGWAVGNKKLKANPAEGVKVMRQKKQQLREKGFEPDEAAMILRHAEAYQRGTNPINGRVEPEVTYLMRKWVPWLCAYTGARVGEMIQLRKRDIKQEGDGVWTILITPEAHTVKGGKARKVVVHPHLIERGFIEFAASQPNDYLFLPLTNDIPKAHDSARASMVKFIREVLTDLNVAPNHGWRHTFKTIGRGKGIADSVLDAICGHSARTVGGSYGSVPLEAQVEAMARFPRFDLS